MQGASYAPIIMPEYRRAIIAGGTYFFTVTTQDRLPLLTSDEVRQTLREGLQEVRQSLPFIVEAWVLLPDHLHTIWTLPEGDADYQARWAIIKRAVSKRCIHEISDENPSNMVRKTHPTLSDNKLSASMQKRREGGFWQRRFWEHAIRGDEDFQRYMDYLHWNPVKHGYVKTPLDWPYSTLHRFVAQGVYPSNWGGGCVEDYSPDDFGE
jgi:putative transposase